MNLSEKRDLTTGDVKRKLLKFTLPIVMTLLLQAVYNVVDMIIVGQHIGAAGMSAVSTGGQATNLLLVIIVGFSNGAAVVIGQLSGSGKMADAKKVFGSFVSFSVILALVIAATLIFARNGLVTLLKAPAEAHEYAVSYLGICSVGMVFIYVYNAFNGALRGIGESMAPMLIILVTTVENIVLDLLFVIGLDWGVAGAAWATVISQATSMVLVVAYTCRKTDIFKMRLSQLKICRKELMLSLKVGFPQAAQFTLTNISFLLIISLINSYGVDASAAAGAANRLSGFGIIPGQAFMSGLMTLTAQNLPVGNHRRIMEGWRFAEVIVFAISAVIVLVCRLWPGAIYRIFTSDTAVAEIGTTYLRLFVIAFIFDNFMFCMFGVLTGSGNTHVTFLCAILSAFGARYLLAVVLSRYTSLGFNGIALAYTSAPIIGIIVAGAYLASGKWKKSRVRL